MENPVFAKGERQFIQKSLSWECSRICNSLLIRYLYWVSQHGGNYYNAMTIASVTWEVLWFDVVKEFRDMGDMEDVKVEQVVIHQLAKHRLSWRYLRWKISIFPFSAMFEQPHKFADIICHIVLPFLCVLNLLSFIHQYCKCTHPPIIWYQHHTFLLKDFLFSHGWIPFGEPISVFPFFASPNSDSPNVAFMHPPTPPSHLIPPSHFFVQNLCADVRINSSWILLPSLRRQSPIPYPSPDIAVMPPLILLTFLSLCNPSSSFASVNWFLSNLPPIPIAGNL